MNGLQVFYILLFPTGRLPSRRWRWLGWLTVTYVVVGVILGAFSSGALLGMLGPIQNPLGIEGFSNIYYKAIIFIMGSLLTLAVTLSVFIRLRRAIGVERQQIKWFAYAAAAYISAGTLAYPVPMVVDTPLWFERVGFALNIAFIPAIPIAIGIAILRYRLYDIDTLINRTLVYGSLTLMLALVYFGGVTATQVVFRALTGQEEQPQLTIVVSTLVIAALFTPLRRRIQSFIDRRFYRNKYDARKTLEAFSAKLRNDADLEALSDDLVGIVRETMQPAHVSLWLRPDTPRKGEQAV
jgi:MFS family permease